ncbi:hypothetical protein KSP40_PGU006160 [Platanthera guangdongensis]|uniref:RNase H type-1 domain-containing protein n=1 Tax=Platanthera guangdongensis TaxID=2320717 RepID=A0ABR2LQJ2_9ASPA
MTEFMAAIAGLRRATQHYEGTLGLIIEGDSMVTINRISRILAGCSSGQHESLTARLMKDFPRVDLSLVDRMANSATDHLAKNACYFGFDWVWGMPLTQALSLILTHDANFL